MKISVSLSSSSIDNAIRTLEAYKNGLPRRAKELCGKLAAMGATKASLGFARAIYDGAPDNEVSVEETDTGYVIKASGETVLFVEFGTGVVHPNNHPLASEMGMIRGAYGKGHGSQNTWGYYGEPGTNGWKPYGRDVVLTHGNPANMPMYLTAKELRKVLVDTAREVFKQ